LIAVLAILIETGRHLVFDLAAPKLTSMPIGSASQLGYWTPISFCATTVQ
jgi:hypothetical protein